MKNFRKFLKLILVVLVVCSQAQAMPVGRGEIDEINGQVLLSNASGELTVLVRDWDDAIRKAKEEFEDFWGMLRQIKGIFFGGNYQYVFVKIETLESYIFGEGFVLGRLVLENVGTARVRIESSMFRKEAIEALKAWIGAVSVCWGDVKFLGEKNMKSEYSRMSSAIHNAWDVFVDGMNRRFSHATLKVQGADLLLKDILRIEEDIARLVAVQKDGL